MEQLKPNLTTERIYIEYPEYYGVEMIQRHLRRYEWAKAHLAPENIVLDAGCGSGYGSRLLRQHCKAIVGVDLSPEAIAYAQAVTKSSGTEKIHFVRGDLSQINSYNLEYRKFDKVVCIEAIEHLAEEQQNKFMEGVVKLLSPNGQLLITTPIKSDKLMTEYHVKEFSLEEFKSFLSRYFQHVVFDSPKIYNIEPPDFLLAKCYQSVRKRVCK